MSLILEIVTPEARVYSDTIDTVVIPTVEGEIGILPGHIPLLTQVAAGELVVSKGATTQFLAVDGGFAQVSGGQGLHPGRAGRSPRTRSMRTPLRPP